MKKFTAFAAILSLAHVAFAETIYCSFTEPFLTVNYNSDTSKVVVASPTEGSAEFPAHMTFQKDGILKITVEGFDHYMEVNTTKEGSDGMSDFVYPFEGVVNGQLYGGCETDALKKSDPNAPQN